MCFAKYEKIGSGKDSNAKWYPVIRMSFIGAGGAKKNFSTINQIDVIPFLQ